MRGAADGNISVSSESATGKVSFVRATGNGDLLPDVDGDTTAKAVAKATAYLERFGAAFGARPEQLKQTSVTRDQYGSTVTYSQQYQGVEVFGSAIRAHLDGAGQLTSVNGFAAPDLSLDVTPRLSESDAGCPGDRDRGRERRAGAGDLDAASTELVVYRMGSTRGEAGPAVLTWVVEVTNAADVREKVFLDARTGKVVNRYSMMAHALNRQLIEASIDDHGTPGNPDDDTVKLTEVWKEGEPTAGLNPAQLDLHDGTGEAYWLFKNAFNRRLLRRSRRHDDHGQQRPAHRLPQRQLERHQHQLLRRRDLRRHGRARVGARLHRAHVRPHLPVAVRAR